MNYTYEKIICSVKMVIKKYYNKFMPLGNTIVVDSHKEKAD